MNERLQRQVERAFAEHFGRSHSTAAYAPGRVEVLGNHTDYNEGFVLSAAIDCGTFFLAAPSGDQTCRLVAGDIGEEVTFRVGSPEPDSQHGWANYVIGVLAGLLDHTKPDCGFLGMFLGNIPLGAGLSSSAALEISTGLALCELFGVKLDALSLAKIGQKAEHEFAGVKCGLLDQMSSLFGEANHLVMSDFRSLDVETVPMGEDACFLMCNTRAKHALVDGEYNARRTSCEEAAQFFASALDHPVAALRDVSGEEWEAHAPNMDALVARRSAHIIGENTRVVRGRELLQRGDLEAFGKLMFESHQSSRENFENSCPELDTIVAAAEQIPGALGARLSGGGFGGSAVVLVHPRDVDVTVRALRTVYEREQGHSCDIRVITPSDGARLVHP